MTEKAISPLRRRSCSQIRQRLVTSVADSSPEICSTHGIGAKRSDDDRRTSNKSIHLRPRPSDHLISLKYL